MIFISSDNYFKNSSEKGESDLKTYRELKQIYKLFESIIESSYDAICVIDSNAIPVLGNDAYFRKTEIKEEEVVEKSLYELIDEGLISDAVTLHVLKENSTKTIIQKIAGKEFLTTGTPVYDESGEITHVVTNLRDMSDLNKLKSELYQAKKLAKDYFNKYERLKQLREDVFSSDVITHSKESIDALRLVKRIANIDSTVLLLGESGVGKGVFANILHYSSERREKPFVKVNCAAIPNELLESELFGYERGAFTGADSKGKPGYFEQANGGTILLDEIGDTPIDLQVKLLKVVEEYEIMRVGGTKTKKINVRIISATNRDLEKLVEQGEFRKDLYYRLNIVPIKIPALRNRKADIGPLAYNFLKKMNEKYNMFSYFRPEVIRLFERYHWPGNIREMENLIERLVVTSDNSEITANNLPEPFFVEGSPINQLTLKKTVEEVERKAIQEAMREYRTTRRAAEKLGISQSTLVKKMKAFKN